MLNDPKRFLKTLSEKPGVYQMLDNKGAVLYVGKAKNLKKRVSSYFRTAADKKTALFMAQVKNVEVIITPNENSALLLELNLIKKKKPRYNVLFKDDKSFPYLVLTNHKFPRLEIYRGAVNNRYGKFFGPFPDAGAVNFVLRLLQKIFKVRVCKDNFMQNRSRPCMLHQIKLCVAPCMNYIAENEYDLKVKLIEQFLNNQNDYVLKKLTALMEAASMKLNFEKAANYRDQIASIRKIQSQQSMTKAKGNYDVLAVVGYEGEVVINVLFVRNGLVIGNKNYSSKNTSSLQSLEELLSAFITQRYFKYQAIVPDKIFTNLKLRDCSVIADFLKSQLGCKVVVSDKPRGSYKSLVKMAEENAVNFLKTKDRVHKDYLEYFLSFKKQFGLSKVPKQIECFDVSHTMGESQVASCVSLGEFGPDKTRYRRFNIKTTSGGDDYAALYEALIRRYINAKSFPDVLIIDGGPSQLGVAIRVFDELEIKNVFLLAVAKGEGRKPGLEVIHIVDQKDPLHLLPSDPILHLIQQVRDEAHRFALSLHRKQMLKSRSRSNLEDIPGVGKARRVLLLKHFGGVAELENASVDELAKVSGINKKLAQKIHDHLHA